MSNQKDAQFYPYTAKSRALGLLGLVSATTTNAAIADKKSMKKRGGVLTPPLHQQQRTAIG